MMNNGDMPANVVTEEQWDRSSSAAPAIGETKREHYAGLAMQGFITAGFNGMPNASELANMAVNYADALLKELD